MRFPVKQPRPKLRQRLSSPPVTPLHDVAPAASLPIGEAGPVGDIVCDMLVRVVNLVPVSTEQLRELEDGLRHDWGGDETYVCKTGESVREKLNERDERIRAQARRGERVPLLSRRWHLSPRRIRQILAG